MLINIVGAKTAAKLQTILTIIIGGAGILLIVASVINGTVDNLDGQMFAEVGGGGIVKSILSVAVISPFYLIGFDVIPQAAEEINVPPIRSAACSSCRASSRSCSTHSSSSRSVWS